MITHSLPIPLSTCVLVFVLNLVHLFNCNSTRPGYCTESYSEQMFFHSPVWHPCPAIRLTPKCIYLQYKFMYSIPCTEAAFGLGDEVVQVMDRYRYLGLVLTQFMDLNITVRYEAQAAHWALGVLFAKRKSQGDLLFRIFTKLYNFPVQPILDYGAAIWGTYADTVYASILEPVLR